MEEALRADNVELPAGRIESRQRYFIARVDRSFREPSDFNNLVLSKGNGADLVRLGDVARVEKAAEEEKTVFRRKQSRWWVSGSSNRAKPTPWMS